VLFVSGHYLPHTGGVERFVAELSSRLKDEFDIGIWSSNTNAAPAEENDSSVLIRRFTVLKLIEERYPLPIPDPLLLKQIRFWLRWKPDIVITNTRFFVSSALGTALASKLRCPHLHIEHGSSFLSFQNPILEFAGRLIDRTMGRWVLRRAASVAGVSSASAEFARALAGVETSVIPNGVEASRFEQPASAPLSLQLPGNGQRILFVGRLLREKGAGLLAKVFLNGPFEDWHLVIAGDGPEKSELPSHPRVHILGSVDSETVRNLMWSCEVFCHPSSYPEGLPTVLLEAASAGMAIISSDAGGSGEVIQDSKTGILVPRGEEEPLLSALERLCSDAELRRSYGHAARAHVVSQFDWDSVSKRLSAQLYRMLDEGPSCRKEQ